MQSLRVTYGLLYAVYHIQTNYEKFSNTFFDFYFDEKIQLLGMM